MWQSGDQYSQWALNPSAYQNVAHDKVDWAALAQQWIQMKDTHPEEPLPAAPPPPSLGRQDEKKKEMDLEGGEAPMEMEKEDLENSEMQEAAPAWGSWNNWQQWGNWGWGATGVDPNGGVATVPPPTPAAIIAKQSSMVGNTVPVPGYAYSSGTPGYVAPPAGNFDYSQAPVTEPFNQVLGYWTPGPSGDAAGNNLPGQGHGPAPFIRNNRQDWRRGGRGHDRTRPLDKSDEEEDTTVALDAAKRKQLPAWIREGLEKMEREKQKKIDRDRQIKERELYLQKKREEEEALNQMQPNNSGQPMMPKKSKFESDSDDSDRCDNRVTSPVSTSRRKSRFRNADSPTTSPLGAQVRDPTPEPEPVKTQEEILHERMLKVRRLLTEILLEVTTEEMESVAQEVLTKAKAKAPALQLRKTPALASLTGKLGLGMYGDSDESDSDDSSDDRNGQANGADSDEELKDQIQRRKLEFLKTEREIEARLLEEEEKERARERRSTADATDDDTGDERQVEKHSDSKRPNAQDGIRYKEEQDKTPRPASQPELDNEEENSHNSNSDRSPCIKKEKNVDISDHSPDRKSKHQEEMYKSSEKIKWERNTSSDDNEESSSGKSDSDDSSSSKSASSSSVESRRSSKKSSKSSRLHSHEKTHRKKRSVSSERKHKKSEKKFYRSKDRRHDYESSEQKGRDKKKEKYRKSRSRSRSGRSFSKETKLQRSHSGESRRSKRSRSRESYRSKTSHRDSQSASRGSERHYSDSKHSSHKGHYSRSKEKNHKGSSYKYRNIDSLSPIKERKSSSSKRRRDSSFSRSRSPSKNRHYSDRKDSVGRYTQSRSNSPQSRSHKKSRRHRSWSSSDGSTVGAKGKAAGR